MGVLSKASNNLMFDGSEGRITQQYCSQERDLVQRQPANALTCPKCGKFKKSGKKSCCGRGGSWYKNCGTSDNKKSKKFDHTWFEGIQVCKSAVAKSFASMNAAEKFLFKYSNITVY